MGNEDGGNAVTRSRVFWVIPPVIALAAAGVVTRVVLRVRDSVQFDFDQVPTR